MSLVLDHYVCTNNGINYDLYINQQWAISTIASHFKLSSAATIWRLLIASNIIANQKSFTNTRMSKLTESKYHRGYHDTWCGTRVFYRSSYELEYCYLLDKQQTIYEMESLRIPYWDSQLQKERIAIPDFYLKETNTIVEVKSFYTYNKQNMIDRLKQYQALGYNFKLFLDKKEYSFCP